MNPAAILLPAWLLLVTATGAPPAPPTAPLPAASAVPDADATVPAATAWPDATVQALFDAAGRPGDAFDDLLLARALRAMYWTDPGTTPAPGAATAAAAAAAALERRALASATGDWRAMALLLADPRGLEVDAAALADALAAAQPDNGYAQLVVVAHAWKHESPDRFVAAIARASQATGFRAVYPLAAEALRRRIGRDDLETIILATSIAAAAAMPAYQNVVSPCREAGGTIAAQCLAFAQLVTREGDSVIDIGIGAAIVEALGSEEQKRDAIARRDAARALSDAAIPAMAGMEHDAAAFGAWLSASAEHGEIGALRRLLARHGGTPGLPVPPR